MGKKRERMISKKEEKRKEVHLSRMGKKERLRDKSREVVPIA